ncbi:signal peptidase I [Streptomyces sp. H27-H1]|uniref:signal peptidase I n=1 Tax=Streptomyces sp. H27-H1 TaxID=2996461 RepID=UPI00226D8AC7|nr:signal peptidase I [Streptomyces sp. H27-H1]MCY0931630.1 signal peptidase I [Streptomyces sp. H27-H1]
MPLSAPPGRRRRAACAPEPETRAPRLGHGRAERRRLARRVRRRRAGRTPRRIAAALCGSIALTLLLKTFAVQAFVIPSGSMEPTLRVGDRVLVDTFTPWLGGVPARGEVVVFTDPGGWLPQRLVAGGERGFPGDGLLGSLGLVPADDGRTLIKRVVAVGGDTVEGDAYGRVRVDGVPVEAPGTDGGAVRSSTPFHVTVPTGRLFVLGDNRGNSADSRAHLDNGYGGSIPKDAVVGEALAVVWPLAHGRTL